MYNVVPTKFYISLEILHLSAFECLLDRVLILQEVMGW